MMDITYQSLEYFGQILMNKQASPASAARIARRAGLPIPGAAQRAVPEAVSRAAPAATPAASSTGAMIRGSRTVPTNPTARFSESIGQGPLNPSLAEKGIVNAQLLGGVAGQRAKHIGDRASWGLLDEVNLATGAAADGVKKINRSAGDFVENLGEMARRGEFTRPQHPLQYNVSQNLGAISPAVAPSLGVKTNAGEALSTALAGGGIAPVGQAVGEKAFEKGVTSMPTLVGTARPYVEQGARAAKQNMEGAKILRELERAPIPAPTMAPKVRRVSEFDPIRSPAFASAFKA